MISGIAWLLRRLTANAIAACITLGVAIGITNFLVNHMHWLSAYLIACPAHGWRGAPSLATPLPMPPPIVLLS